MRILFYTTLAFLSIHAESIERPPIPQTLYGIGPHKVSFQSMSHEFLCAEHGGQTYLIANRAHLGPWEEFEIHCQNTSCTKVQIATIQGWWLDNDLLARAGNKNLRFEGPTRFQKPTIRIATMSLDHHSDTRYALRNEDGNYWVVCPDKKICIGDKKFPGESALFQIKPIIERHDEL
ncbi:MAG: hypothetical protein I8H75_03940 [Myxococcaceae bacterium]|nr:hypothetical protein [Myxococcaceae bacterium]MBH2006478.1 hypothetical protein [Myxococcaceae bacterium]